MSTNSNASAGSDSLTASVVTAEQQINKAIDDLDITEPISNPLLWAARCSLDVAVLLLRARMLMGISTERDRELILEAVAQARAAVGAATYAAGR